MRRFLDRSAGLLAFLLLTLACFQAVLFRGEQFGYRDASSYYYPLHARTTAQWKTGQIPLWDPWENGGLPLLGNPTAAVLYPGKAVFAILPLAWASRLYLVGHVALAFGAMAFCLRRFGVSRIGSLIGGLTYGFGGPVLLQYCNAIYLVGSAWLPLGVLAVDSWVRLRRSRALVGLAIVLAMQVLGGDIEIAYTMGLFAVSYTVWMIVKERVRRPSWRVLAIATGLWIVGTPILAAWLPQFRDIAIAPRIVFWVGQGLRIAVLGGLAFVLLRSAGDRSSVLIRGILGLIMAAIVGAAVAGAQLLPVAELSSRSFRMADDLHMDPFGYSLEPYRLVEFVWPGFFGIEYPEDHLWLLAIPPNDSHLPWVSTLFLGTLPLMLAAVALKRGEAPPWRTPLAAAVGVGLLLSFGRFGSPLYWARAVPDLREMLGPHGVNGASLFRAEDGLVRDSFGSPYWWLATLAPGFGSFRFPSKLLVYVSLGVAGLAGLGWDRVVSGMGRIVPRILVVVVGLSACLLVGSFLFQGALLAWVSAHAKVPSLAGPIDPSGAMGEFRRAMIHAMISFALASGVILAARRGKAWAGIAAVILLAGDLAVANARYIWTIPQSEFEKPSLLATTIQTNESQSPSPSSAGGPFRIQRMPEWHPLRWVRTRSPDRLRELAEWQRDTLQSGHGMLHGLSYTLTPGVIEPETFLNFFDPWTIPLDAPAARMLGLKSGQPIRYYPRRAFDLWGARYFILPKAAFDWLDPNRAIASFLPNTEVLAPDPAAIATEAEQTRWVENQDWQLLKNVQAFPRAWVVHDVRLRPDTLPAGSPELESLKRAILYADDPFWKIPGRPVEDLRATAWIQAERVPEGLRLDGDPASSRESVTVVRDEPTVVELDANLERDGLVVLASQDFPGWTLKIDGTPSPIVTTNLAMRGAFVPSGSHRLVYRYEPRSFRIGLGMTAAGLVILAITLVATRTRRETLR